MKKVHSTSIIPKPNHLVFRYYSSKKCLILHDMNELTGKCKYEYANGKKFSHHDFHGYPAIILFLKCLLHLIRFCR